MTTRYLHTVTEADVGRGHVIDTTGTKHCTGLIFGPFQPHDVGKRIYLVDNVIQMENNEQRDKRMSKEEN